MRLDLVEQEGEEGRLLERHLLGDLPGLPQWRQGQLGVAERQLEQALELERGAEVVQLPGRLGLGDDGREKRARPVDVAEQ